MFLFLFKVEISFITFFGVLQYFKFHQINLGFFIRDRSKQAVDFDTHRFVFIKQVGMSFSFLGSV
jgi:hypothetical protein